MKNKEKTKEQLADELQKMHGRVAELEALEAEHKQAEKAIQLYQRCLEIANRGAGMAPVLKEFVAEILKVTGCAAAGIRILDEEGNIPYQAYEGFSQEFYESENPLSIHSDQCMCVNVVKREVDPNLPFYTQAGSFYTNSTTRLLATTSEEEKGRTRNVCNLHGYESVALIPIRLGSRVLGLVHVADPRENMVPVETVNVLEHAAMQLGTVIQGVWNKEEIVNLARFPSESPDPVLRVAKDGKVLYANSAGQALLAGWRSGIGKLLPDDWRESVLSVLASASSETIEVEHSGRTLSIVVVPLADAGYLNLYARDITEQRRLQERERKAAAAVAAARSATDTVNAMGDGLILLSMDGKITAINPALEKITGYEKSELLGASIGDLVREVTKPGDLEKAMGAVGVVLEGKVPAHAPITLFSKDGTETPVVFTVSVIRDAEGALTTVVATVKDITELKRAEDALRKSEASLAEAQRIAHLGNWDWDIVSNELRWSDEIYRVFGLAPQEFGATYEAFLNSVHPDDREFVKECVNRALYEDKPYSIDHRIVLPNGLERIVHEQAEVFVDQAGRPIRMIGTVQDITEREWSEQEAGRLREQIAHVTRVATMGELAASLAHELNQPLAAILSNAQAAQRFLASDTPDFDEVRQALADIVQDDRRAGEVIRRLRALLKRGDLERTALDINQIIQEIVSLLHSEAVVKGVSIKLDLATDLPPLLGDRIQLQQAIMNLLLNGIEAMTDRESGSRELIVRTLRGGPGIIEVAVQDSGTGLEEQNMDRIFNPFFTTKPEGLGMGLSINRSIVEAHGGRLWATNNHDRGATFHLALPISEGHSI